MGPQLANVQPAPKGHFTNCTEISYEETRNGYDRSEVSEITPQKPTSPPASNLWHAE